MPLTGGYERTMRHPHQFSTSFRQTPLSTFSIHPCTARTHPWQSMCIRPSIPLRTICSLSRSCRTIHTSFPVRSHENPLVCRLPETPTSNIRKDSQDTLAYSPGDPSTSRQSSSDLTSKRNRSTRKITHKRCKADRSSSFR